MRPLLRFLLPALLVAGCASTTQVTTRFTAEGSHPAQETLLLVAHTPEGGTRETWELTCKEIFSSSSLTILLSHQELPLWYEGGKNRILDWAQSNDVHRILVVELTHQVLRRLLVHLPVRRDDDTGFRRQRPPQQTLNAFTAGALGAHGPTGTEDDQHVVHPQRRECPHVQRVPAEHQQRRRRNPRPLARSAPCSPRHATGR